MVHGPGTGIAKLVSVMPVLGSWTIMIILYFLLHFDLLHFLNIRIRSISYSPSLH